jgi:hypothetical protein
MFCKKKNRRELSEGGVNIGQNASELIMISLQKVFINFWLKNSIVSVCSVKIGRCHSECSEGRTIRLNLSRDNTHINPLLPNDL